jgi:hypothetical protein
MLPSNGSDLPAWRQQVAPWIMAAVRLAAAYFVTQGLLHMLVLDPGFVRSGSAAPQRFAVAALLGAGALLFAWPRTFLAGAVVLLAGLGGFEWIWQGLGMRSGPLALWSASIVLVLAAGEWLVRRVQRTLYRR